MIQRTFIAILLFVFIWSFSPLRHLDRFDFFSEYVVENSSDSDANETDFDPQKTDFDLFISKTHFTILTIEKEKYPIRFCEKLLSITLDIATPPPDFVS